MSSTPQPTKSYLQFESVAQRSLHLLALQRPVEQILATLPQDSAPLDLSDMSRASVVLIVAGMDAYFTDVFAERLVPYLRSEGPTKQMIAILGEAGLDTECALKLLAMKRPYRRVRKLIDAHLALKTTQRQHMIDELFLAYGLKDFCANVQKLKKRKNLLRSIALLVARRHKIAHEGDLNSHGRVNPIDPDKTRRQITAVLTFVSGADELLQRQMPV
jgi:hypothetical protein